MSTALLTSRMGTAMREPVHAQQQAFRAVLMAMAWPGRVIDLPVACVDGIEAPQANDGAAIGAGLTALLLTLLDRETTVRLHPPFDSDAVRQYLRFHTGVRNAEPAAYEVVSAAHLDRRLCQALELGTDEAPQHGATLIVDVPGLDSAQSPPLLLSGPGIEWTQCLPVGSLEPAVWRWRIERQTDFPRGVDMLFVQGLRVAALPRSTRLQEMR
jgi:alpha-D-ribose 1-methylphosphonate 5-triphosphate synthase subunit PhnH